MKPKIVVIGTSAGGVDALKIILQGFKRPSSLSVLVVLHLPAEGPNLLPEIYQDNCDFRIKEAESGEQILPETIYVAPPNYHLSAESNDTLSLSNEEAVNYSRPSIDVLMESAAASFGREVLGILLTGANHDGAAGMKKIFEAGGTTVIQNLDEAEYPTMPASCLPLFKPHYILSLKEIASMMTHLKGAKNG